MNARVDDWASVNAELANADALLLDFDGPVCSVFSGLSARVVARELRQVLARGGNRPLPIEVQSSRDPFEVLRFAANFGKLQLREVELAATIQECEAVKRALPTPGAHRLVKDWRASGRKLAIVSNNSRAAVNLYLAQHGLMEDVSVVSARWSADLSQLKPSPYLVRAALIEMGVPAKNAVLVGDSIADIQAARAAKVRSIGFANRSDKVAKLGSLAGQVITRIPRLEISL